MFRASLRSVSDPVRDNVCFSCLARRFGAPTRLRQCHAQAALRAETGDGQLGNKSEDASGTPPKPTEVPSLTERSHPESPSEGDNPGLSSSPPPKKSKKARKKDAARQSSEQEHGEHNAKKKSGRTSPKPGVGKNARARGYAIKLPPSIKASPSIEGSPSIKTVTQMLEERAKKAEQQKQAAEQPKQPSAEKAKLTHIAGFVREKETGSIYSSEQKVTALDVPTAPVPRLSFGLDRVLFNPGVYQLRDPRSRVYNFDPYLGQIMPVTEFDFNALKAYITSSKDEILRNVAVQEKKKYVGSSSSMTSVLSHFHYLLSGWRAIDTRTLSQGFPEKMRSFTRLLRAPAAMFLHYQDGVYAIDADKEFDSANILMNLGKSMEKLLTLPKEDFERYRRTSENKISPEEEQAIPESYHYSTSGDFIMRSQLDAYDPRLPGTGMFDLKTRAVVSIRQDAKNFEHGLGYEIKGRFGAFESYEREFYDMIRAAFLKYSLQVRVGRMDGIFVAFHNVERIFGFQYISLPEMDQSLHGQSDTSLGDTEFQLSLSMWNKILDKATEKFPKQSLRFHFETRDAVTPFMYIFAEPVTQDDIHAIQTKNKAEVEAYQQRLLNLSPKDDNADLETETPTTTESSSSTMTDDSAEQGEEEEGQKELLAMALTVRNKVNDKHVERPVGFTADDKWTVEYELSELSPSQGHTLYRMCQARRQKALEGRGEDELEVAGNVYIRRLRQISKQGREYRERENELDKEKGVVVLGDA